VGDDVWNASGAPAAPLRHVPALDGVRGLAILLVLLVHFAGSAADPALASGSAIERVFARLIDTSGCGVDLFFVLSGFLITRILLHSRGGAQPFRRFYARRVLRIFPLYYLALFIVLVVVPPFAGRPPGVREILDRQGWLWLYGGNIACGVLGYSWNQGWMRLDHFWSLAVEEHFYFVWPFLALRLPIRTLVQLLGVFVVLAITAKIALVGYGMIDASYQLTPCRLDALSLGALIAIVASRGQLARYVGAARRAMLLAAAAVVVLGAVSHLRPWLWWTTALVHTMFALFFAGLLVLVLTGERAGRLTGAFSHASLRTLGKYSYGLYVWHEILRPFLHEWVPLAGLEQALHSRLLGVVGYAAVCIAIAFAVAYASWHLFEKHFLGLKSRVEYTARPMSPKAEQQA
jgi:peptidoglycan/LPS O-acetylase OafA/YrhL